MHARVVALSALLLAAVASARWCQVENVKADVNGDYTFRGPWRLEGCTTLSLDHGMCAEADCPWRTKFEDEDIIKLADSLHGNSALTALSIASNKLTDESVKAIAEALRDNEVLTDLNLQDNLIGDEGALALSEVLGNSPVFITLNMGFNQLTNDGAKVLIALQEDEGAAFETLFLNNNTNVSDENIELAHRLSVEALQPPPGWTPDGYGLADEL